MADVPEKYVQPDTDDYGDGKYVSTDLLLGEATSRAYLKAKTEDLEDATDPELRKWITPFIINPNMSYGVKYNAVHDVWNFDDAENHDFATKFHQQPEADVLVSNEALSIDYDRTTARVNLVTGRVDIPQVPGTNSTDWTAEQAPNTTTYTRTVSSTIPVLRIYDRTNNLTYLRVADSSAVHSATGTSNGAWCHSGNTVYLKCKGGVAPKTLDIDYEVKNAYSAGKNGHPPFSVNTYWYVGYKKGEPYWATPSDFNKTLTDTTLKTVLRAQTFKSKVTGLVPSITLALHGNVLSEDTCYVELRTLDGSIPGDVVKARASINPHSFPKMGVVTIPFKHPVPVSINSSYAIVVRSPFTSYAHHVGVGGWGVNCLPDKYPDGNSFTSYDNGVHWVHHVKDEGIANYNEGAKQPQDFAFQVNTIIDHDTMVNKVDTDFWLYFKPIRTNPMTKVTITPTQYHTGTGAGTILWQYSTTKLDNDWHNIDEAEFWKHEWTSNYPTKLWIRAKLRTAYTADAGNPYITEMTLRTDNNKAMTGYMRTLFFSPKTDGMMGSKLWSRINAPVVKDAEDPTDIGVTVDIIRGEDYDDLIYLDEADTICYLSNLAAEPLKSMIHYDKETAVLTTLYEYRDYTVDYSVVPNKVTFGTSKSIGTLKATYNILWMKGLEEEEFEATITDPKGGLKIDMLTERFDITTSRSEFGLKVVPADPVRKVSIVSVNLDGDSKYVDLEGTEIEGEIYQGKDYDVDISDLTNPHVTLHDTVSKDIITESEKYVEIKYTPSLADSRLALAYRLTRVDDSMDVDVGPCYFQTRI